MKYVWLAIFLGVTAEVMKSDYHKWTAVLSKEELQQQIDFYKERYKQ